MKRIGLMTLALATIVGTANAGPVDPADRAASKFNLFGATLSVSLTGLPTLAAGRSSQGTAINANGEVVGFGETDARQLHAFYWSPANPTAVVDIDPFDGGDRMEAKGINDNGVVVGFKHDFINVPQAFKWTVGTEPGKLTRLVPLVDAFGAGAVAADINNGGQVVGWSVEGSAVRATLWANGAVQDLGLGSGSKAHAINEAGEVVGEYLVGGQVHGFFWTQGSGVTDLGTLGGTTSLAWDLNENAWVVGESKNLDGWLHAFLWSSPSQPMLDLDPDAMSVASGVNGTPHAVGVAFTNRLFPVLWGPDGLRQDLGTLAGSDVGTGWAFDINASGQVVGVSFDGSVDRPTIWTIGEVGTPPVDACGPSMAGKIRCLIVEVEQMELRNRGQARSLLAKLEAAEKKLQQAEGHAARGRAGAAQGNEQAAENMVNAFRKQVHTFVMAGMLEDESAINAIIDGTSQ